MLLFNKFGAGSSTNLVKSTFCFNFLGGAKFNDWHNESILSLCLALVFFGNSKFGTACILIQLMWHRHLVVLYILMQCELLERKTSLFPLTGISLFLNSEDKVKCHFTRSHCMKSFSFTTKSVQVKIDC